MIDLEKEREAFKQKMLKDHYNYKKEQEFEINRYGDFSWIGTDSDFEIWQMCAEEKQAEINDLKQKLNEAHKSRASWVEYKNKVENPEYVLVPRRPTDESLKSISGNIDNARHIYKAMIEAVEKDDKHKD